jgi:hypothetical protein
VLREQVEAKKGPLPKFIMFPTNLRFPLALRFTRENIVCIKTWIYDYTYVSIHHFQTRMLSVLLPGQLRMRKVIVGDNNVVPPFLYLRQQTSLSVSLCDELSMFRDRLLNSCTNNHLLIPILIKLFDIFTSMMLKMLLVSPSRSLALFPFLSGKLDGRKYIFFAFVPYYFYI